MSLHIKSGPGNPYSTFRVHQESEDPLLKTQIPNKHLCGSERFAFGPACCDGYFYTSYCFKCKDNSPVTL